MAAQLGTFHPYPRPEQSDSPILWTSPTPAYAGPLSHFQPIVVVADGQFLISKTQKSALFAQRLGALAFEQARLTYQNDPAQGAFSKDRPDDYFPYAYLQNTRNCFCFLETYHALKKYAETGCLDDKITVALHRRRPYSVAVQEVFLNALNPRLRGGFLKTLEHLRSSATLLCNPEKREILRQICSVCEEIIRFIQNDIVRETGLGFQRQRVVGFR